MFWMLWMGLAGAAPNLFGCTAEVKELDTFFMGWGSTEASARHEAKTVAHVAAWQAMAPELWVGLLFGGDPGQALYERWLKADSSNALRVPGFHVGEVSCDELPLPKANKKSQWKATWGDVEVVRDHPAAAMSDARRRACLNAYSSPVYEAFVAAAYVPQEDKTRTLMEPWGAASKDLVACLSQTGDGLNAEKGETKVEVGNYRCDSGFGVGWSQTPDLASASALMNDLSTHFEAGMAFDATARASAEMKQTLIASSLATSIRAPGDGERAAQRCVQLSGSGAIELTPSQELTDCYGRDTSFPIMVDDEPVDALDTLRQHHWSSIDLVMDAVNHASDETKQTLLAGGLSVVLRCSAQMGAAKMADVQTTLVTLEGVPDRSSRAISEAGFGKAVAERDLDRLLLYMPAVIQGPKLQAMVERDPERFWSELASPTENSPFDWMDHDGVWLFTPTRR
jgi:hypothetical protein